MSYPQQTVNRWWIVWMIVLAAALAAVPAMAQEPQPPSAFSGGSQSMPVVQPAAAPEGVQACTPSSSISGSFNSNPILAGHYIWFNSSFVVSGLGSSPVNIYFDNSQISFTAGSTPYNLTTPRAVITFSPAITVSTTTYDSANDLWMTSVPITLGQRVFVTGLAFPVPTALPGGISPVTWSGRFTTDSPGVTLNWRWSAAVYSTFSTSYNTLGVKPVDGSLANPYPNSDPAGTPEYYRLYVVAGGTGAGSPDYIGQPAGSQAAEPCLAPLPDLAVDKYPTNPARTVWFVGEEAFFQIRVTNTATNTLTFIPLYDEFDNVCFEYTEKTATPVESAYSNLLGYVSWQDLAALNRSFLFAGQSFTTTLPLAVRNPSANAYNRATVAGARDEFNRTVATRVDEVIGICADVRISISPETATNPAGQPHTFTVTVEKNVGNGWEPAPGVFPVVTFNQNPSSKTDNCATTGTNANGQCTVVINSTTAGVFVAHAAANVTIGGATAHRETNGMNGNSGDATKTYVDASIGITPGSAFNKVGDSHTFTVTVRQDAADGLGMRPAPNGTKPTVTISGSPAATIVSNSCSTTGTVNGVCTVVINSNTAATYTANASVTLTVGGVSVSRSTSSNPGTGGTGPATKTYVDLRVLVAPGSATNAVNDAHTFTVTVQQKVGDGAWTAVPNGTKPTVTISPTPSSKTDNCASVGTTSGVCTVVINSTSATVYTATVSATVSVSGVSITRVTGDAANTAAGGTGPATKTYVNLRISLSPLSATNAVNAAHTFTVLVEEKIGNGAWTAKQGVSPTVTISPAPSSKTDNCAAPGATNASGQCTVVINSTTATVYTATATVTATVSGQSITRTTGDAVNTAAGGSGPATKTYVNLRISLTPASAINEVTQPHTFTVTVQQKVGDGAWAAVPNGTKPTVTISPAPGSTTDNCASTGTASGVCTVVINSNVTGVYTATASVTVSVSGQSITRTTGDAVNAAAGGTGPATKTYVATASLGNFVWNDLNGNGIQDGGEPGINGVLVKLYPNGTCTGTAQASTTTSGGGIYQFSNLLPGTYCVQIDSSNFSGAGALVGWTSSPKDRGGNDALDSDGDTTTKASPAVTLTAGASNQTIDFGFLRLGTIGDTVFFDDNRNGTQDAVETGILGAQVRLYANGSGNCATLGALLDTKTTDINGKYLFDNVWPGQYCVSVPETPADNPVLVNMDRTAGANPHYVSLVTGQNYLLADFGYAGYGAIRGIVFYDWNRDGQHGLGAETGIPGVRVCLDADFDNNGVPDNPALQECKNTDSQGVFVFTNRLPGTYILTETDPAGLLSTTPNVITTTLIVVQGTGLSDNNNFGELLYVRLGDFVWVDLDSDGQQDPGETTGLSGVNLTMTGVNIIGEPVVRSITTVNGLYQVGDLLPGTYTVTAPTLFSGYRLTNARVQTTTLTITNTVDLTLDFGYAYPTAVTVQEFTGVVRNGTAWLTWHTLLEDGTSGFTVWRAKTAEGPWLQVTEAPLPTQGSQGGAYTFVDQSVQPGMTYWYRLQAEPHGQIIGPILVTAPVGGPRIFLPSISR